MAINWNAPNPARADALPHLPLERLKASGHFEGVITSNTCLGVTCHFIGNRTLPCTAPTCPGCDAQRRTIWEGYITLYTRAPSRHIITALTPGAALMLSDAAPDPNQIRGWWVSIHRHGSRPNGKMLLELKDACMEPGRLPPPPDLRAHMTKIWGLDPETMPEDHPLFATRHSILDHLISKNGA